MVCARGSHDVVPRQGVEVRVFAVLFPPALAVAADVVPCVWVGEGEAVGRDADDVAVLFVQGVGDVGEAARQPGERVGDVGGCSESGARDGAERVEEEVVEDVGGCKEGRLQTISATGNRSVKLRWRWC
jgi:hypothetical protein